MFKNATFTSQFDWESNWALRLQEILSSFNNDLN